MRVNFFFCLLLGIFFSQYLYGEEIPETFTGVRPLGMGNAFTAIANDQNAIWTNPAGISRVRKARSRHTFNLVNFPSGIAGGNDGGKKFILGSLGSAGGAGGLESILNGLNPDKEESIWVRAAASASAFFDAPRGSPWAFAAFSNVKTTITPDLDSGGGDADEKIVVVDSVTDIGGVVTIGWTNKTNRLNFALQIRPTMRFGYFDKINAETLVKKFEKTIKSDANNGMGIGVDFGLMWTFADYWFPTLGFVVKNIPTGCKEEYLNPHEEVRQTVCGTKYSGTVNNPESPSLLDPTDFRLGLSMTPRLSNKIALRFDLDLHHLYLTPDDKTFYGLSGIEPIRQSHAGLELFFGNPLLINPLSFRLGFNQGFITFGGTFRVSIFAIEAAVYGQDLSASSKQKQDTRYIANITTEFE